MIVKCPICPAKSDLGPNADFNFDTRYRVICPEIKTDLATRESIHSIDCPHMRREKMGAILKIRHGYPPS